MSSGFFSMAARLLNLTQFAAISAAPLSTCAFTLTCTRFSFVVPRIPHTLVAMRPQTRPRHGGKRESQLDGTDRFCSCAVSFHTVRDGYRLGDSSIVQHGFYARPSAHLPRLPTRAGLGTISRSSGIVRFVLGGVVKTFRCTTSVCHWGIR